MKKALFTLIIVLFSYYLIGVIIENNIKIPDDAIRIRIIANSNEEYDQNIKVELKDNLQKYMYNLLSSVDNVANAQTLINDNLDNIDIKVRDTLQTLDYNLTYHINFGLNYFPSKKYKGVEYESGYYKSLLITLGEGNGDNWWCVLFPPFCLIEAEESSEIEYKSFVQELIDKYV